MVRTDDWAVCDLSVPHRVGASRKADPMFYRRLADARSASASRIERIESLSVEANDQRLPRCGGWKALQNLRHQRAQLSERIVRRNQHNHRDVECRKILLILELLIDGQEHIEFVFCDSQQVAIAFAGPSHFWGCSRIVARQVAFQATRNTLVKQDAQG